ncbi:hypothetical protein [Ralstonia phage p2137]|nr:hypothetical protein [Ralstonia phage p2137]
MASPAPVAETEATQPVAEPAKPTRKRKAKAEASDSVGESTEATAE